MARGTQLLTLVQMLRDELGRSSSVAVGVDDLPSLKQKIKRTQEILYDEFDWPFLKQTFDQKQMQAGERFYDFPPACNFDRIEPQTVHLWFSGLPRHLERGIGFPEYALYNSQNDVRMEPALKWDIRWTGTKEQMEIWPVPASNSQTVQMSGIRHLRPLVQDRDVADLDDQMIVLFAAAELLGRQGDESAPAVLKQAQARFARVKGRSQTGSKTHRMGMSEPDNSSRWHVVVRAR